MEINTALDKIVAQRQANCDHNYQDRIITPERVFCGKCGKEEK